MSESPGGCEWCPGTADVRRTVDAGNEVHYLCRECCDALSRFLTRGRPRRRSRAKNAQRGRGDALNGRATLCEWCDSEDDVRAEVDAGGTVHRICRKCRDAVREFLSKEEPSEECLRRIYGEEAPDE
jgi:hypothetical protein